jgi:DNA processing protein
MKLDPDLIKMLGFSRAPHKIRNIISLMLKQRIKVAEIVTELTNVNFGRYVLTLQQLKIAEQDLIKWLKSGIDITFFGSDSYPIEIAQICDPPFLLYSKGRTWCEINRISHKVAIVGSRECAVEIAFFTENLAEMLACAGSTVISGLAYGIDAASHRGAISSSIPNINSINTLAVMGNGLDIIYPAKHYQLAKQILASGGALISSYEPHVKPRPYYFLERNQLIAALAKAVIVTQAASRSGALATVRHALNLGRDVITIPGAFNNSAFNGNNRLIKDGAMVALTPEDVLDYLGLIVVSNTINPTPIKGVCVADIEKLFNSKDQINISEIHKLKYSIIDIELGLIQLEQAKKIVKLPGGFYLKIS